MKYPTLICIACLPALHGLVVASPQAACEAISVLETVDLGEPLKDDRALRRLLTDDPKRYQQVVAIVGPFLAFPMVPAQAAYEHGAQDMCSWTVLTTMPPTNVLAFSLDGVRYLVRVQRVAPPAP